MRTPDFLSREVARTVARSRSRRFERCKTKSSELLKIIPLLAILFLPGLASAATITSGYIKIVGVEPAGAFSFSGTDFSANGGFHDGNWRLTSLPCTEPCSVSVNGTVVGNDFDGGAAFISGTNYGTVNWGDLFVPVGRSSFFTVTGPDILLNAAAGTYAGSFSFVGSLCGTLGLGQEPRPCAADLPSLPGSGTVSATVQGAPYLVLRKRPIP